MGTGVCPVRKASGEELQGSCYCSIIYSCFTNIFTEDLEQFGGMSREDVRTCFQRQPRRRNYKLKTGEIETMGRNYPNETFSLAKNVTDEIKGEREGGK